MTPAEDEISQCIWQDGDFSAAQNRWPLSTLKDIGNSATNCRIRRPILGFEIYMSLAASFGRIMVAILAAGSRTMAQQAR